MFQLIFKLLLIAQCSLIMASGLARRAICFDGDPVLKKPRLANQLVKLFAVVDCTMV